MAKSAGTRGSEAALEVRQKLVMLRNLQCGIPFVLSLLPSTLSLTISSPFPVLLCLFSSLSLSDFVLSLSFFVSVSAFPSLRSFSSFFLVCVCPYLPLRLSLSLSAPRSLCLCLRLCVSLSRSLSLSLSLCFSPSVCLSACLPVCLPVFLSSGPSVYLPACLPGWLAGCLAGWLAVCLLGVLSSFCALCVLLLCFGLVSLAALALSVILRRCFYCFSVVICTDSILYFFCSNAECSFCSSSTLLLCFVFFLPFVLASSFRFHLLCAMFAVCSSLSVYFFLLFPFYPTQLYDKQTSA